MKKSWIAFFLFVISHSPAASQNYQSRLKFEQGQKLDVITQLKSHIAQQAMGQAIDFDVSGEASHFYTVTNTNDDNSTLRHQLGQLSFIFDGMGQQRSFNSSNEKDMMGPFGSSVKELIDKHFDMVIDPGGKVLFAFPQKIELQTDERMKIITGMLKELFEVVQPPAKGNACVFKVLPDTMITTGSTWSELIENENGKFNNTFAINAITDSTIVVDVNGTAATSEKSQMMGMDVVTTMTHKSKGQIIIDKNTGIIREKNITTDSNGNSEVMGGSLPVNSKTSLTMKIKAL